MNKQFALYSLLAIALLLLSCLNNSGVDEFKLFSYPPGSAPGEGNDDYFGSIDMWEPHNNIGTITVTIKAEDNKHNNTILTDNFKLQIKASNLDPCVTWKIFDTLIIHFSECHNSFCCDDSGAVHFMDRLYVYDSTKVQFLLK